MQSGKGKQRNGEKGRHKLFKFNIITKQAKINVVFLANADRLIEILEINCYYSPREKIQAFK